MFKKITAICFQKKSVPSCYTYSKINTTEIRRLYLLENAVTNYSGGIDSLHRRITTQLTSQSWACLSPTENEEMESLLRDLNIYLRDISKYLQHN